MKIKQSLLSLLLLLSSVQIIQAQDIWFPDDAVWNHYIFGSFGTYNSSFQTVVAGDTIIDGRAGKKLTATVNDIPWLTIVSEQNDSVFLYEQTTLQTWLLAYDFTRTEGHSITWNDITGTVMETGTIEIGGQNRKYMGINPEGNPSDVIRWYIEGIGGIGNSFEEQQGCGYILPMSYNCSSPVDGIDIMFECFADDAISYNPFGVCVLNSTESAFAVPPVKVFPNPASGLVQIETEFDYSELRIIDTQGEVIIQKQGQQQRLNISHLAPGMYFLHLQNQEGHIVRKRIMRMN